MKDQLIYRNNDINKQKQRLYGTNLIVESPKILKDDSNSLIILNNIKRNTLIISK